MAWTQVTEATLAAHMGAAAAANYTAGQRTAVCNAASDIIERYLDKHVQAADYERWLRCEGGGFLLLPEYPIITLRRVCTTTQAKFHATCTAVGAVDAVLTVLNGVLDLHIVGGISAGTTTLTLSTYTTMALLVAAMPATWTAVVDNEGTPEHLKPYTAAALIGGGRTYVSGPGTGVALTDINHVSGILNGLGGGWCFVDWRAGYTIIPADLVYVAHCVAVDLLRQAARDGGLESEKIEGYQWKARAGSSNDLADYKPALQPFRRLSL